MSIKLTSNIILFNRNRIIHIQHCKIYYNFSTSGILPTFSLLINVVVVFNAKSCLYICILGFVVVFELSEALLKFLNVVKCNFECEISISFL